MTNNLPKHAVVQLKIVVAQQSKPSCLSQLYGNMMRDIQVIQIEQTCQRVSNLFPSGMESFPVLSLSIR